MKITKKNIRYLIVCFIFAFSLFAFLAIYIETHLVVSQVPVKSDIIVILGGHDGERALVAANLFLDGWANKILVTGLPSECADYAEVLAENGVPAQNIIFDNKATTTQTNAFNSSQIIKALGSHRILLVTSWYHSSRGCRTFRRYLPPDIEIVSVPTAEPKKWSALDHQVARLEVLKSFRYYALFGIPLIYRF